MILFLDAKINGNDNFKNQWQKSIAIAIAIAKKIKKNKLKTKK